jgi:hypothetical protein
MKPLSKKAKMAIGWTVLMTVVGTAMLHQANHYDLLKDPEDKK